MGLKWSAVDFERNIIHIRHTAVMVAGRTVRKDTTKNAGSNRELPLNGDIRAMLTDLKERENKNRALYGNAYSENDYLFKYDDGALLSSQSVTRKFSELLETTGFPHMRFHDLRHSCASQMLTDNRSIVDVSKWLGHSTPTVTANVYSHQDGSRKLLIAESRLKGN